MSASSTNYVSETSPAGDREWCCGAYDEIDGVESLADRGVTDRVDVDLQAELVDPGRRRLRERVPPNCAGRLCSPEQYGSSNVFRSPPTPSAKNFTVFVVSNGEPADPPPGLGEIPDLGVEVPGPA